jgi:hypothetical protein
LCRSTAGGGGVRGARGAPAYAEGFYRPANFSLTES